MCGTEVGRQEREECRTAAARDLGLESDIGFEGEFVRERAAELECVLADPRKIPAVRGGDQMARWLFLDITGPSSAITHPPESSRPLMLILFSARSSASRLSGVSAEAPTRLLTLRDESTYQKDIGSFLNVIVSAGMYMKSDTDLRVAFEYLEG
jgi:hypothetical protein